MLREDPNRPHRDTVAAIRRTIDNPRLYSKLVREKDLASLDEAHEAHIRAKNAYSELQSNRTMVNLNGSWARLHRVIVQMDEKYGSRQ